MEFQRPYFSIIIPTYSRPRQLRACLHSLARLDYPRDWFEVIVVDDGSDVPPAKVVRSFRDQMNLTLLKQPNAGPASARNTGAIEAKGKFLAFTDDDCAPPSDWLKKMALRLEQTPDHMIGGRVMNGIPHNIFSETSQLMTDAVYAYFNQDDRRPHFFASNNLVVPADRFRSLGGFDTSFPLAASEDREFCERWLRNGYAMTYAPEAVVMHAHPLTFYGFLRHHFNYGRGALHFHRVRLDRGWGRLKPDPNFYHHLFSYPFNAIGGWRALWLEAVLVFSYVVYTAGFLWERSNQAGSGHTSITDDRYSPRNPKHLAHGYKRSREVQ